MNKKAIGDKNSDDKSQQTRVAKKKAREQELELLDDKAFMSRLKHAGKIMEDLKSTPRVNKQDQSILARNLGNMYERQKKRNPEISMPKLFCTAFGDESGESRHKKRKRYMRFFSDKRNRNDEETFAANGHDYVGLAVALTKLSGSENPSTPDDDIRLAILALVEGTEFDDRVGVAERDDIKLRKEWQSVLDDVIEKVKKAVDLDAMWSWLKDNPVNIYDELGEVETIEYGHRKLFGASSLNVFADHEGPCFCNIAPLVRIGAIVSPYIPDGFMRITVPKSSGGLDHIDIGNFLLEKLGIYDEEEEFWLELWHGLNTPLADYRDWIVSTDFEFEWETTKPVAWVNRLIDIELRFSRLSGRWQACLLVRPSINELTSWDLAKSEVLTARLPSIHGHGGTIHEIGTDHDKSNIYASLIDETENDWVFAVFTDRNFHSKPEDKDDVYSVMAGAMRSFPGDSAYKMVFQDLNKYGHEFTAAIKDCKGEYSTARDDSIAGAILRNIAYAADEDRIDNILLADARHKFELVDALKKESEDKYLHAMQQSGYLKT